MDIARSTLWEVYIAEVVKLTSNIMRAIRTNLTINVRLNTNCTDVFHVIFTVKACLGVAVYIVYV